MLISACTGENIFVNCEWGAGWASSTTPKYIDTGSTCLTSNYTNLSKNFLWVALRLLDARSLSLEGQPFLATASVREIRQRCMECELCSIVPLSYRVQCNANLYCLRYTDRSSLRKFKVSRAINEIEPICPECSTQLRANNFSHTQVKQIPRIILWNIARESRIGRKTGTQLWKGTSNCWLAGESEQVEYFKQRKTIYCVVCFRCYF